MGQLIPIRIAESQLILASDLLRVSGLTNAPRRRTSGRRFSIQEAARQLSVPIAAIHWLIRTRQLTTVEVRGQYLIHEPELDDLVAQYRAVQQRSKVNR